MRPFDIEILRVLRKLGFYVAIFYYQKIDAISCYVFWKASDVVLLRKQGTEGGG